VAIKLPSRRELTVLVPLTQQQQHLYRQMLCSLDSQTLEIVMRDTSSSSTTDAAALLEPSDGRLSNDSAESPVDPPPPHASSSSAGQDTDWRQLMNLLLQLRKVCNHTYLLPDVAPEPYEVNEDIVRGSGKLMVSTQLYSPLSPSLSLHPSLSNPPTHSLTLSISMLNRRCWIGCCRC
jgi:SWI/SNF-related matrix-associated actin-dependent regulator of chromatin subfamily A member 5